MLVLTRKRSEMIQIGDDIRIKVIRTASGHVKLGIEAPEHVRVLRAELVGTPPTVKAMHRLEPASRPKRDGELPLGSISGPAHLLKLAEN